MPSSAGLTLTTITTCLTLDRSSSVPFATPGTHTFRFYFDRAATWNLITEAFASKQAVMRQVHINRGVRWRARLRISCWNSGRQRQRLAEQKRQMAENDRAIQQAGSEVRDLTADEDRIRRNMESLNSVSGQQQSVQNYARELDAHEQRLAALRDRQAELQRQRTTLASGLASLIEGLSF